MELYARLAMAIRKHSGLEDAEIKEAAQHGADTGWAGFTYTADCVDFYNANHDDIWELLNDQASSMGEHPMSMVASFGRKEMATSHDGFCNLLAWFALEEIGRHLTDEAESDTE